MLPQADRIAIPRPRLIGNFADQFTLFVAQLAAQRRIDELPSGGQHRLPGLAGPVTEQHIGQHLIGRRQGAQCRQGGQLLDAVEQRVEMLLEGREGSVPFPGADTQSDDSEDDDDDL